MITVFKIIGKIKSKEYYIHPDSNFKKLWDILIVL